MSRAPRSNPQSRDNRSTKQGKAKAPVVKHATYDKIARTKANKARHVAREERRKIRQQAKRIARRRRQELRIEQMVQAINAHGGHLSALPTRHAEKLVLAWRSSIRR